MKPDRIEQLLGGWAAGTLSTDENELLMREAVHDQQLFNALADEEALREALADPIFRARLRQVLAEPADVPSGVLADALLLRRAPALRELEPVIEMAAYKVKPAQDQSGWWSWLRKPWPLAAAATLAGIALFMMITGPPKPASEPAVELAQNRVSETETPLGAALSEAKPVSLPESAPQNQAAAREPAGKVAEESLQKKNTGDSRLSSSNERLDQPASPPPARGAQERQRDESAVSLADQKEESKKEKDAPAQAQVRALEEARPAAVSADRVAPPPPAPMAAAGQMASARAKQSAPAEQALGRAVGGAAVRVESEKADKLEARAAAPPQARPPAAPAAELAASSVAKSQAAPQFIHHLERRAENGGWVRTDAASLRTGDAVRISLLSPADAVVTATVESPGSPPRSLQSGAVKAGQRVFIPSRGSLPSSAGVHRVSIQSSTPGSATAVGFRSNTSSALPSLAITLEFR